MSPKNLHSPFVKCPPFPDAPKTTSRGKVSTQHRVSYSPFIQRFSAPPIRGMDKSETRTNLQIQNAPLIRKGFNTRDRNSPASNEKQSRRKPAVNTVVA